MAGSVPNVFDPFSILDPARAQRQINDISGGGGGRTLLTQDTTFYVSTSGSDSTGDGSVGKPYRTAQFINDWGAANLDADGFNVFYQFADGTYDGLTISGSVPNAANVVFQGNASDKSKVIFNDVATGFVCVEFEAIIGHPLFSFITFAPATSGNGCFELDSPSIDSHFSNCHFAAPEGGGGDALVIFDDFTEIVVGFDPVIGGQVGGISVSGNWSTFLRCAGGHAEVVVVGDVTLVGTPSFSKGFISLEDVNNLGVIFPGVTFVGSATGPHFNLSDGSCLFDPSGSLTNLPGNVAGTFDGSCLFNFQPFAWQISGTPATSNLPASTYGVFKDTSGGGVYLAYNDAGTIKKVSLT